MTKKKKEETYKTQFDYATYQRAWGDMINRQFNLLRFYQIALIIALLVVFMSSWYAYSHIVKPKMIPYVVEVNPETGDIKFKGMLANSKLTINDAVMVKTLREFISYIREVPADRVVLTKNLAEAYYYASPEVSTQLTTYVQDQETSPFGIWTEETRRDLAFTNFQQTSEKTWSVQWTETYRQDGVVIGVYKMSGSFTYSQTTPENQDFAEHNPFGILFTYYSVTTIRSN